MPKKGHSFYSEFFILWPAPRRQKWKVRWEICRRCHVCRYQHISRGFSTFTADVILALAFLPQSLLLFLSFFRYSSLHIWSGENILGREKNGKSAVWTWMLHFRKTGFLWHSNFFFCFFSTDQTQWTSELISVHETSQALPSHSHRRLIQAIFFCSFPRSRHKTLQRRTRGEKI